MIKMLKEEGPHGCPLVILGLSHANLDKLRSGRPILLDIDQCAMLGLGQREVMIYAGSDEVAMTAELEENGLLPEGAADTTRAQLAEHEARQARVARARKQRRDFLENT